MRLYVYLQFYEEINDVVALKLTYLFKIGLLKYAANAKDKWNSPTKLE